MLSEAGVKKSDIQNPETAKFILNTIGETIRAPPPPNSIIPSVQCIPLSSRLSQYQLKSVQSGILPHLEPSQEQGMIQTLSSAMHQKREEEGERPERSEESDGWSDDEEQSI